MAARAHPVARIGPRAALRPCRPPHLLRGHGHAIDFARETEAILVGEPIGARPYGYQENGWFTLPHSGLRVSTAIRLYRFGPEGEAEFLPDQRIDTTRADFVAGLDPALDWTLRS